MTKDALERVLSRAANAVASGALAGFTKATIESEWNLARRLAIQIQRHLRELDCDTDVIKPDYGRKRPDIIFHIRNTHAKNFLVIETKYEGTPAAVRADVQKIKENWFRQPLRYRFGAVINLRDDGTAEVLLLKRPAMAKKNTVRKVKKRNA